MNARMKTFCDRYMSNGFNALEAYCFAYDRDKNEFKNPPSYPYDLLKKPEVKAYIDGCRDQLYEDLRIDGKHILTELAQIAFAEKGDEVYTTQHKLKALETLSKNLGLQTQKIETKEIIEVSLEE